MIPFVHIGTKRSFNEKDRFVPKELHVPLLLGPIKTWERNVPNWDAIRNKQFLVELCKLSRWEQVFPITLKENLTGNRN